MDKISFQSRIRVTNLEEYRYVTSQFRNKSVNFPWTIKESVLADKAHTQMVYDCTVCGITDGLKVLLLHICPTIKENLNFKKIENYIKNKIDLKNIENLQGFLLGSQENIKDSTKVFNFFEDFLKNNNIPFSKFKNGDCTNHVAYSSITDEWLIANEHFNKKQDNSKNYLTKHFKEVELADFDEFA